MITRPRSALFLSFPYNFTTKEEAIEAKKKFRETLHDSNNQELSKRSIATTLVSGVRTSTRSYKDHGPSLFHDTKKTYSHSSKFVGNTRYSKPKRLQPCKRISHQSIQNMKKSLKAASDETAFINSILVSSDAHNPNKSNLYQFKKSLNKISTSQIGKENRFFNIHGNKNISLHENEKKKFIGKVLITDENEIAL